MHPKDIPALPDKYYKGQGWTNWGEILATGKVANYLIEWREFEKALKFARSLKLKGTNEWRKFINSG